MSADVEVLLPPDEPGSFESLCLDLWADIWGPNSGAKKNGRSGQPQAGVDFFGQHDGRWIGVQCKQKKGLLSGRLKVRELEAEVTKALAFTPPLASFILATSGPAEVDVQTRARELTEAHIAQGLFAIEVWSWERIWHELYGRQELFERVTPVYWPRLEAVMSRRRRVELAPSGQRPAGTDRVGSTPRPKVFISYSHKDRKALLQLQRHLKPLEREGLLSVWEDTSLEGGEDWERRILAEMQAATVAILLISQDFLASDFVAQKEIPLLLAREATGQLTLLPVIVGYSGVETLGFADPKDKRGDKVLLTKFQGFGHPDRPLASQSYAERDRVYVQVGKRLQDVALLANSSVLPLRDQLPVRAPLVSAQPRPTGHQLTVHLEVKPPSLVATYQVPGLEPLCRAETPWERVLEQIAPIHDALDRESNLSLLSHLERAPNAWGEVLFSILFGEPERWEPIFRALFDRPKGTPQPFPTRAGVFLRVHSTDSRLSGLPWRLTAWQGQPLIDHKWLFTTTSTIDSLTDHHTTAPSSILVVAPTPVGGRGGPHDLDHSRALADALQKVWPTRREAGYLRVAGTRNELEQALQESRPHIVYFYGRGSNSGGRPSLLLDGQSGQEALTLNELRLHFERTKHTPGVLYLNCEGLHAGTGVAAQATPDQIFRDQVPLLLWRRRPEWSADSATTALQWFVRWLGAGTPSLDPVAALHDLQGAHGPMTCETCALAVHANYRHWRTDAYEGSSRPHFPQLQLDRDPVKSRVRKHLEELAKSPTRRVLALIAHAAPGNSLAALGNQLRHDFEGSVLAKDVAITWLTPEFPSTRSNLERRLEEELLLQLGAEPGVTATEALRRHAPRALGGRKPVLWLDWGAFGDPGGPRPALQESELTAWLQFCSRYLADRCPPGLHLVSYLGLGIPQSDHKRHSAFLLNMRKQDWCQTAAFRLSELPTLEEVAEADLLDFLQEPGNSSCDPNIQPEVAARIIAQTGGVFEQTVALLEEAENGSWYDLLARLRVQQEAATHRET